MKIWHMNGAGNDFMVMDVRGGSYDLEGLAKILCKQTGADGFMALDTAENADFRLHFYNSDGSRGEMCGHGARCICRFAYDHGIAGQQMVVQTDAGAVLGQRLAEDRYRVRLPLPEHMDLQRKPGIAYVEVGCPHAVQEHNHELWEQAADLKEGMRALRFDPAFPKGANVDFYRWESADTVQILTFERGVEDFTLACGTGSGAVAAVLYAQGKLPGGVLHLRNRGGVLTVSIVGSENDIQQLGLEGPADVTEILEMD